MKFYAVGYRELEKKRNLFGIFFSDLGVIFKKKDIPDISSEESIRDLCEVLDIITKLNREYLVPSQEYMKYGDFKFMTKCAIAFGNLNIKDLPELNNIRKQPLYGQGFIDAYESAEGISDEPMQIGEIRITYKETPHFKEKLKRQKKSNNFLKDLYKIGSKCAYFSWTGKSNPSKELNKIFKVGEQEALKAYKKKMDNVYKKQLNLYTKWANYRGT